jgi:hypothetical protein
MKKINVDENEDYIISAIPKERMQFTGGRLGWCPEIFLE